ncbi:radical SAM protein [Candidatus Sumerlaeota bacterium]|nr:radical SAM protein [Candidatus Sumerlaeota bacterium]
MDVLVINEPFVKDFCRTQRWAARTRGRVLRAPDWLAYATAVLEEAKIPVKLYDFPALDWNKDKLREIVRSHKPRFVVLDSTTPSIFSDIECARICKEESDAHVIMVGPHASAVPEETLESAKGAVDVICIGEYDYTVRDIIMGFDNLASIPGIAYKEGERVVRTMKRPLIDNLDALPFPAWHHLNLLKYFDGGKLHPYIDIIAGRGCPNACIFCLWPQVMHGMRFRLRSPENVVDEMERDIKLCPQVLKGGEFFFEDDTFTVDKNRAMGICEEILKRNLKLTFSVNARVDTADDELFRMMKRAGCRELLVGFESGDQGMLDRMHKNATIEDALRFMEISKKHRLDIHGCFVLGLPGETKETIEKTIRFALGLGLHTVQFSGAVPFPGTRYFEYCKKEGLLKAKSWEDWLSEGEQAQVVDYPGLTKAEIDSSIDKGLKKFYFRPTYMIRFLFQTRSRKDLYRKLRGAKNFLAYLLSKKK